MIDKININQIPDFRESSSAKQAGQAKPQPNEQADASLQIEYASLIEKAVKTPRDDDSAVEKARELLLSGRLDSPENIRQAAENIIKFGV
jgi:hypothetical protein